MMEKTNIISEQITMDKVKKAIQKAIRYYLIKQGDIFITVRKV